MCSEDFSLATRFFLSDLQPGHIDSEHSPSCNSRNFKAKKSLDSPSKTQGIYHTAAAVFSLKTLTLLVAYQLLLPAYIYCQSRISKAFLFFGKKSLKEAHTQTEQIMSHVRLYENYQYTIGKRLLSLNIHNQIDIAPITVVFGSNIFITDSVLNQTGKQIIPLGSFISRRSSLGSRLIWQCG